MKHLILLSLIVLSFSCKKKDVEPIQPNVTLKTFTIESTTVSTHNIDAIKEAANQSQIIVYLNQEVTTYLNGLSITKLDIVLQDVNNIASINVEPLTGSVDCNQWKETQLTLYLGYNDTQSDIIVLTLKSGTDNVMNTIFSTSPGECKQLQLNMGNKLI